MKPFKVFRPSIDDVERLSYGKGAKKRGTGSKYVCHRLNRQERVLYDIAKKVGYLSVTGSSYRKQRKGSPIRNTFRQRCDALERLCVIIEKRSVQDRILIDFSTLRMKDDADVVNRLVQEVIIAKYPELLQCTKNFCKEKAIEWNKIQNLPIWNINERLVIIECDRHVAKSMASEILEHGDLFDTTEYDNAEFVEPEKETELRNDDIIDIHIDHSHSRKDSGEIDDEIKSIDWDDI